MTPNLLKRFAFAHGLTLIMTPSGKLHDGVWTVQCVAAPGKSWLSSGSHHRSLPGDGLLEVPDWKRLYNVLLALIADDLATCPIRHCAICDKG